MNLSSCLSATRSEFWLPTAYRQTPELPLHSRARKQSNSVSGKTLGRVGITFHKPLLKNRIIKCWDVTVLIFLFNKPCIFEFAGRLGSVKVLCLARAQKVFGSHLISCVVHTSGVTEQIQKGERLAQCCSGTNRQRKWSTCSPALFLPTDGK